MKNCTRVSLLAVAALAVMFAFSATASAEIIAPTATEASSFYSADFSPDNTINGSALSSAVPPGNPATVTHDGQGAPANVVWHTASVTVAEQYIRYDLGAAYNITGMYVSELSQFSSRSSGER